MLASIPVTDEERAAADDGQAALDQLQERLTDFPASAGPARARSVSPPAATLLPVVEVSQRSATT
ncbi:hypothetical protein ACWCXB_34105 [Streptomyces sp. NPDC001514]